MGLLDYYRRYEDIGESEANRLLRERRAREKAVALEAVPLLDLSGTEWPEFPNPDVVSASVYTARGRINGYPDRHATPLRRALAERHYIKSEQIVIGNGVAELLQTAAHVLLRHGDALITPWPSNSVYPTIALRAGARPVPVDLVDGRPDPSRLAAAVTDRTHVITLCNPNDPTGAYLDSKTLAGFLGDLPDHVYVLVDESYIQFQDVEEEDAVMRLVADFPRLFVFRTFSKIYGLSGLRAGYVVGSTAATSILGTLAPVLGVNALTQAAVGQALKIADIEIAHRRRVVIQERRRLLAALRGSPISALDSQANFVWMRAEGMNGNQLADGLEKMHVRVARGGPLGDDDHVRAAIRDAFSTDRLVAALGQVTSRERG